MSLMSQMEKHYKTEMARIGLEINRAMFDQNGDKLIELVADFMKSVDISASNAVISRIPVGAISKK